MGNVKPAHKALIKKALNPPDKKSDKYSRGVLGIITGSRQYPGAGFLTVESALKTGVGMIRFLTNDRKLKYLVLEKFPETVTTTGQVQAWLLGSGIDSKNRNFFTNRRLSKAIGQSLPQVLDAGALYLAGQQSSPTVITPHHKELAQLLNEKSVKVSLASIQKDPSKWAKIAAQELGVIVFLKGNLSVITDGKKIEKIQALTTQLATAGSGDVLAGILAALLATNHQRIAQKKISLIEISLAAGWIHQYAALLAAKDGPVSASMLIQKIPVVIKKASSR